MGILVGVWIRNPPPNWYTMLFIIPYPWPYKKALEINCGADIHSHQLALPPRSFYYLNFEMMIFCATLQIHSSSKWDSHFHFYVLTIYVCLYWLWGLVVFYSLVCRGYIQTVRAQLVQGYFPMIAVLIVFHAANKKKTGRNKIKTRKQLKK